MLPSRSTKSKRALHQMPRGWPLRSFFSTQASTCHSAPHHLRFNFKMKIFDWVHRRFAHKEGLAESGKKRFVVDDVDSVRDNNALSVFDGWKEGILTIGTLGYDPLKDELEKQQYLEQENDSDVDDGKITDSEDDDEEEEEANPLVYAAAAAAYAHDCEAMLGIKGEDAELDLESEFDAMIMSIPKKERITLAELFIADSEKHEKKLGEVVMNKPGPNKHGFSFAKKLIGDKDGRPIQKLHRLMRMMLKRKIHPDEGVNGVNSNHKTTPETASLLPHPQDAVI